MHQLFFQTIPSILLKVKDLVSFLFTRKVGMAIATVSLLMIATACSTGGTTSGSGSSGASGPEVVGSGGTYSNRKGQQTELYDAVQPNTGKMNQHNDDFRYDKGESQNKADKLIRQADRNLDKVQSPKDYVENLKDQSKPVEWTNNFAKDTKENAEQLKTDISKGTERGAKNLKANAKRAADNVQESADETAERVRQTGKDAVKTTQRAVNNAGDRS
jgi:hypothetical protein